MALEQLAGQTTAYGLAMAELMFKKLNDEEAARQANLENWMKYLQQIEQKRHAEAEAKRRRNQAIGMKIGAIAGAALMPAALSSLFPGAAATGGLEGALVPNGATAFGGVQSGLGDFVTNVGGTFA